MLNQDNYEKACQAYAAGRIKQAWEFKQIVETGVVDLPTQAGHWADIGDKHDVWFKLESETNGVAVGLIRPSKSGGMYFRPFVVTYKAMAKAAEDGRLEEFCKKIKEAVDVLEK